MNFGISAGHYNQYDSDSDVRSWPIMQYDAYGSVAGQIEVWPVPSNNGSASTKEGVLRLMKTCKMRKKCRWIQKKFKKKLMISLQR